MEKVETMSTPVRYHRFAVFLHWTIAILILILLPLGFLMGDAPDASKLQLYQMHKTFGLLVLGLSLVRLGWRWINPAPKLVSSLKPWERILSKLTHSLFYLIMVGMPLVGWAIVSTSSKGTPTMMFGQINWPHLPFLHNLEPVVRKEWHHLFEEMHEIAAFAVIVLLILHVGAAIKHQIMDKDQTMARMTPGLLKNTTAPTSKGRGGLGLILGVLALFAIWIMVGGSKPAPANTTQHSQLSLTNQDGNPLAANWDIIAEQSELGFGYSQSGVAGSGVFSEWTAAIYFDPDNLPGSKVVVAVDVISAKTGDAETDQSLPASGWLDAANHPASIWTSTQITRTGDQQYLANGKLKLRGLEVPFDIPFALEIDPDGKAHMNADVALKRLDFGVGAEDDSTAEWVDNEVGLQIRIIANPVR
jgi:cytochrome b561